MSKRSGILISSILSTFLLLSGCATTQIKDNSGINNSTETKVNKISAEEAKNIIESNEEVIIVDVREQNEYEEGHIKDSILLPLGEIESKADKKLTDKEIPILVYCRSGRRSAEAANILSSLGYENVYDFGGIIDWPYDIEK